MQKMHTASKCSPFKPEQYILNAADADTERTAPYHMPKPVSIAITLPALPYALLMLPLSEAMDSAIDNERC